MNKISNVVIKPLVNSNYLKPVTMHFTQNGCERIWDLLLTYDSVQVIIYNITRNNLVLVKQFRPAVYVGAVPPEETKDGMIDVTKYPPELGITLEFCGGLLDTDKSAAEIAKEEVLKECGYDVPLANFTKVAAYRSGVGTSGALQTLYYCEVTDDMKKGAGGGVEDEIIDVVEMSIPEIQKYLEQDAVPSPPSFMFAFHWFLYHKLET